MCADGPSLYWPVSPRLTRRLFHARLSLAVSAGESRGDFSASIRQGSTTQGTDIEVACGTKLQPTGTSWRRRTSSVRDSTAVTRIQKRANIGSFWSTWTAAYGSES